MIYFYHIYFFLIYLDWISFSFFCISFWLCFVAYRILVPQPGIEPVLSAVQISSPNHWTAREFSRTVYFSHPVLIQACGWLLVLVVASMTNGLHLRLRHQESACQCKNMGLIPGLGRFPGKGNGYPLWYSFLENSMDRGVWQATVHRVTRVGYDWVTNTFTFHGQIMMACQLF